MKRLIQLLASRIVGFVLIAALAFAGITLVVQAVASLNRPARAALQPIPHPSLKPLEPIVRKHIEAVRGRCDQVQEAGSATAQQRGRAFAELGKVYLAYHHPEAAVACFQNASAVDHEDFRWWYYLAHSYRLAAQEAEAVPAMARAVKAMDNDVSAGPGDLAAALCFLGDMAVRLNKTAEAKKTLEQVLNLQPANVYALVQLGRLASQAGRSDEAIDCWQRALKVQPGRSEIRSLLRAEYQQRGNADKAAALRVFLDTNRKAQPFLWNDPLRSDIDRLNRSASQQVRQGAAHHQAGRMAVAAVHFAQALQANPDDRTARVNLASWRSSVSCTTRTRMNSATPSTASLPARPWTGSTKFAALWTTWTGAAVSCTHRRRPG